MDVDDQSKFLSHDQLQKLVDVLIAEGYDVIGPTIDQSAVVYRTITQVSELPCGWSDSQQPAVYRLKEEGHRRYFYFNSSPDSWKRYLFPAMEEIGTAVLDDDGWQFETSQSQPPQYAFLGVRPCDLAAISIQDCVLAENDYVDAAYRRRRDIAFTVVVQCSTATSTCFCSSMGTGPECHSGFDLAMTETEEGFVIAAGSDQGRKVLVKLNVMDATGNQIQQAKKESQNARSEISKEFDTQGLHDLLLENLDHPNWQEIANRCLSCANCTMVCPTCFCSTVEDKSNLDRSEVSRVRSWDSCFNVGFSYMAGGTVQKDIRSRYRQWLTHKLATWEDQFDVSGCTGCGRCITWCPVGIDLTEEVAALRSDLPIVSNE